MSVLKIYFCVLSFEIKLKISLRFFVYFFCATALANVMIYKLMRGQPFDPSLCAVNKIAKSIEYKELRLGPHTCSNETAVRNIGGKMAQRLPFNVDCDGAVWRGEQCRLSMLATSRCAAPCDLRVCKIVTKLVCFSYTRQCFEQSELREPWRPGLETSLCRRELWARFQRSFACLLFSKKNK